MTPDEREQRLKKRAQREKKARIEAESVLEAKSLELFEANQSLKLLAEGLEETIKVRTEMLEEARDEAIKASHIKSEFLANMSHEIRTPLNGVIGLLNLLTDTQLNQLQKEYVVTAGHSANALLELVNDILDLAKIEAGKLTIEIIDFDLHQLLESILNLYQGIANDKNNLLDLSIDFDVPRYVKSDPTRLKQILCNLISNAIKFTQNGRIEIKVSNDFYVSSTAIKFSINDSGIGIPQDKLNTIFESFTQADGSTTRKFGGTGLGLNIVKNLTKMMGQGIQVTSELGSGSQFNFVIVCEAGEQSKIKQNDTSTLKPFTAPHKILLVEDHPVNEMVARAALNKIGLTDVTHAENGLIAVNLYQKNKFDVILMDCQMPEMDGYTATAEIRSLEEFSTKHIPIIAMTANAMSGDSERCFAAGMDDYISKPFELSQLHTLLMQWLIEPENIKQAN